MSYKNNDEVYMFLELHEKIMSHTNVDQVEFKVQTATKLAKEVMTEALKYQREIPDES